jgi:hypothetical protein
MNNYYVKITVEDIDIASNFFENDKHLDEFIANVSRYYCQKPITIKTKIVKRYFESYKKTMDRVMANRINGKKGGEQNIKNQLDTNKLLEAPIEALVKAPLEGKLIEVKENKEILNNKVIDEAKDLPPSDYTLCIDFWLKEFHIGWTFTGQSGKALKSIITKIKKVLIKQDGATVPETFKLICYRLPEWYKEKDLPVIDSKFNEIITEIKNSKNGKPQSKQQPVSKYF